MYRGTGVRLSGSESRLRAYDDCAIDNDEVFVQYI